MPHVRMTAYAYEKMHHYIDACRGEVSGMGKCVQHEDGTIVVTDCTIFEQEVTGAHSDIDTASLARFQCELIGKGEDVGQWRVWWHSHANMATFWSGTDTNTIDSSTEFQYLVSIVSNHAHDVKCRVDVYTPFRMHADVQIEVETVYNEELKKTCLEEISQKVRAPKPKQYGYGYGYSTVGEYYNKKKGKKNKQKDKKQPTLILPYSKELESMDTKENSAITNALFDEYYDELEELQNELMDAYMSGDNSTIYVADELLQEHIKKGESMGISVRNTLINV